MWLFGLGILAFDAAASQLDLLPPPHALFLKASQPDITDYVSRLYKKNFQKSSREQKLTELVAIQPSPTTTQAFFMTADSNGEFQLFGSREPVPLPVINTASVTESPLLECDESRFLSITPSPVSQAPAVVGKQPRQVPSHEGSASPSSAADSSPSKAPRESGSVSSSSAAFSLSGFVPKYFFETQSSPSSSPLQDTKEPKNLHTAIKELRLSKVEACLKEVPVTEGSLALLNKDQLPLLNLTLSFYIQFKKEHPEEPALSEKKKQTELILSCLITVREGALSCLELYNQYDFMACFLQKDWDNCDELRTELLSIYQHFFSQAAPGRLSAFYDSVHVKIRDDTFCYSLKAYEWLKNLGVDFNQLLVEQSHWFTTETTLFMSLLKAAKTEDNLIELKPVLSFLLQNNYDLLKISRMGFYHDEDGTLDQFQYDPETSRYDCYRDEYEYTDSDDYTEDYETEYSEDETLRGKMTLEYLLLKKFDNLALTDEELLSGRDAAPIAPKGLTMLILERTCYSKKAIERLKLFFKKCPLEYNQLCDIKDVLRRIFPQTDTARERLKKEVIEKYKYACEWFMETAPSPEDEAQKYMALSDNQLFYIKYFYDYKYESSFSLPVDSFYEFRQWMAALLFELLRNQQFDDDKKAILKSLQDNLSNEKTCTPTQLLLLVALGYKPENFDRNKVLKCMDQCYEREDTASLLALSFAFQLSGLLRLQDQCLLKILVEQRYFSEEQLAVWRQNRHIKRLLELKHEIARSNIYRAVFKGSTIPIRKVMIECEK